MSTPPQSLQVSGFRSQVFPEKQSPLGFLRALSARVRSAFGADLTADLLEEGITDLSGGIAAAATEARGLETLVEKFRRHWTEFWADGTLDAREQRILTQDQRELASATSQHTTTLDQIS